jgi:NADH-quinone oxidoreductase subunit K
MSSEMSQFFWVFSVAIALVMISGFYCLLLTHNLIRALIGLELLTKGMTLFIILAGYITGHIGLAQAMAITLIVIEVVVIVVAVGVVLGVFRHTRAIDARLIRNIKG